MLERLLVADGDRRLLGLDRAILAPGQGREVVAGLRTEARDQRGLGVAGDVADRAQAELLQRRAGHLADPEQPPGRQRLGRRRRLRWTWVRSRCRPP